MATIAFSPAAIVAESFIIDTAPARPNFFYNGGPLVIDSWAKDHFVGTGRGSLDSLQSPLGQYYTAVAGAGGITVGRSDFTTPGSGVSSAATAGESDTGPHLSLARDNPAEPGRLYLHFSRDGDTWATHSDDDAGTWSAPENIMPGIHPEVAVGLSGEILLATVDPDTGQISSTIQYPGDTDPSDSTLFVDQDGNPILSEDDVISLEPAYEPEQRMTMFVRIQGEDAPSTWFSAAYDYSTWERAT